MCDPCLPRTRKKTSPNGLPGFAFLCGILTLVEDSSGGNNKEMRIYDHWKNTSMKSALASLHLHWLSSGTQKRMVGTRMHAVGKLASNETCREKAAEILDVATSNFHANGKGASKSKNTTGGGGEKGKAKGKNKNGRRGKGEGATKTKKEKTEQEKKTDELNKKIRESLGLGSNIALGMCVFF